MRSILRHSKRVGTAFLGGLVIVVGVILIPYPGPGWLIVFAGFAILATEFEFASTALEKLRGVYDHSKEWLQHQPLLIRIAIFFLSSIIVILTAWLLNTFGLIDRFFHLHQPWLHSPLLHKK